MNLFNSAYSIFITAIFLLTLNVISSEKKPQTLNLKPGCYDAPIYVYDEERKKYYRQDWCKSGKQRVYFDSIPAPQGQEIKRSVV